MRRCIAEVYTPDIARMQRILMMAGKDLQVDEIVTVWFENSSETDKGAWSDLPHSDEELLLKLLDWIVQ